MGFYRALLFFISFTIYANNKQIFEQFFQNINNPKVACQIARENPWIIPYCSRMGHLDAIKMVYEADNNLFYSVASEYEFFNMDEDESIDIVKQDTLLHSATRGYQVSVVNYLLEKGLSPFVANDEEDTPLFIACIAGDFATFQTMVEHLSKNADQMRKLKNNIEDYITEIDRNDELELGLINILSNAHINKDTKILGLFNEFADKNFIARCACYAAIQAEDISVLNGLIESQEIDFANEQKNQFLHAAAVFGKYNVVQCLLENSIPIYCLDGNNESALSCAVQAEQKSIVELLLPGYTKTQEGVELLIDAFYQSRNSAIDALLLTAYERCEYRLFPVSMRHVLLYGAVENANIEDVKNLLHCFNQDNSNNINFGVVGGNTVLHKALEKRDAEIVQLLLNNGADICLPEKRNKQQLFDCCLNYEAFAASILNTLAGSYGLVYEDLVYLAIKAIQENKRVFFNFLKSLKIDLSRVCRVQAIAPCVAALRSNPDLLKSVLALTRTLFARQEMCKEFVLACNDNNAVHALQIIQLPLYNNNYAWFLSTAFRAHKNLEKNKVLQELLRYPVCINSMNSKGETVLAQLIEKRQFQLARILMHKGANLNIGNLLPLGIAVEQRNVGLVKELLENGANVNRFYKNQPIIMQVINDILEPGQQIFALLLKANADYNIVFLDNNKSTTPFIKMPPLCRINALTIRLLTSALKTFIINGNYDAAHRILIAQEPRIEEIAQIWNSVNALYNGNQYRTGCALLDSKMNSTTDSSPGLLRILSRICDVTLSANTQYLGGNTLLHRAVFKNDKPALKFLVDHGGSFHIKNHERISVARLAQKMKREEVLKLEH